MIEHELSQVKEAGKWEWTSRKGHRIANKTRCKYGEP